MPVKSRVRAFAERLEADRRHEGHGDVTEAARRR